MAWSVDEVKEVALAVEGGVLKRRRLRLDGNAALALEIHRVEHLLCHFAVRQPAAELDDSIRKRALAVVDMGNDGKVANMLQMRHPKKYGLELARPLG